MAESTQAAQGPPASAVARVGEGAHVGTPDLERPWQRSLSRASPFHRCAMALQRRNQNGVAVLGVRESPEGPGLAPPLGLGDGRHGKAGPWQFPGKARGVSSAASLLSSTSSCICRLFKENENIYSVPPILLLKVEGP